MPRHPPCALTILTVIIAISHVDRGNETAVYVSLEHAAGLSLNGDVLRSLCSFQRSLRRLSQGSPTTVSQNSTACWATAGAREPRVVWLGWQPKSGRRSRQTGR